MAQNETNIRSRKKPERYGDTLLSLSSGSEDIEPFSADTSLYEPEQEKTNSLTEDLSGDENNTRNDFIQSINFDDEFEEINQNHVEGSEHNIGSQSIQNNENTLGKSKSGTMDKESLPQETNDFQLKIFEQLQSINDSTSQVLVRISAIEESLIRNGTLISVQTSLHKEKPFEKFHSFVKAHNLPIKSVESFGQFEKRLDDDLMEESVR